jgi:hypothetical protein
MLKLLQIQNLILIGSEHFLHLQTSQSFLIVRMAQPCHYIFQQWTIALVIVILCGKVGVQPLANLRTQLLKIYRVVLDRVEFLCVEEQP